MVGGGSDRVYRELAEHSQEVNPICLQNPLLSGLVLSQLVDADALLGVLSGVVHVYLEGEEEEEEEKI